nr:alpha subunit of RNA polymerase [Borodinellopsis texensis]
MTQYFISLKESKIENMRSFYGCFSLGPFEPSESITVANALRRTLLSELKGISIVSVEIEGIAHEYSTIPGIKDSVLDILLNLKEIVLKKNSKNLNAVFRPQIGYLRARGPGIIKSGDLRLPPFIQCVDPNQYIATLADDGILNMKFIIQQGGSYLKNHNLFGQKKDLDFNILKKRYIYLKKLLSIKKGDSFIKENLSNNKSALHTNKGLPNNFADKLLLASLPYYYTVPKNINTPEIKILVKSLYNNNFLKKKAGTSYPAKNLIVIKAKKQKSNFFKKNFLNFSNFPEKSIGGSLYTPLANNFWGFKNFFKNFNNPSLYIEENQIIENKNLRNNKPFRAVSLSEAAPNLENNLDTSWQTSLDVYREKINHNSKNITMEIPKNNVSSKKLFSNLLHIDAVFNPINKVNYTIEVNEQKTVESAFSLSSQVEDFSKFLSCLPLKNEALRGELRSVSSAKKYSLNIQKNSALLKNQNSTEGASGKLLKQILFYSIPLYLAEKSFMPKSNNIDFSINNVYSQNRNQFSLYSNNSESNRVNFAPISLSNTDHEVPHAVNHLIPEPRNVDQISSAIENNLENLNRNTNQIQPELRHNILLEIWTNGSIHPRVAIFLAFKKLLTLFLKLKEIKTATRIYNSATNYKKLRNRIKNQSLNSVKKKNENNLELIALNEKEFMGNYTTIDKETTDNLHTEFWTTNFKEKLEWIDVGTLKISLRTYTLLKRNQINTVADLIKLTQQATEKDLLKIFQKNSIYYKEIQKSLSEIGFNRVLRN